MDGKKRMYLWRPFRGSGGVGRRVRRTEAPAKAVVERRTAQISVQVVILGW